LNQLREAEAVLENDMIEVTEPDFRMFQKLTMTAVGTRVAFWRLQEIFQESNAPAISAISRIKVWRVMKSFNEFDVETLVGEFFVAGKLIEYSGAVAPKDFVLPEGMEIVPWEHPRFFWLTVKGKLVAGPAKREILESFVHDLCTNPCRQEDLAVLHKEVKRLGETRTKM